MSSAAAPVSGGASQPGGPARLTSLDAEARLRETGRDSRAARPLLDAVAAQLILQTWFESPHHVTPS